jgi:hypothetical protein
MPVTRNLLRGRKGSSLAAAAACQLLLEINKTSACRLGSRHDEARLPVTAGPLPSLTAGRKCGATRLRVADGYLLDHQSPACVHIREPPRE